MTLTTHFKNDCTRRQHQFISICIFLSLSLSLNVYIYVWVCVYRYFSSYGFRMCLLSVSNCIAVAINVTKKKTTTWNHIKESSNSWKERKRWKRVKRMGTENSFRVLFRLRLPHSHAHTLSHSLSLLSLSPSSLTTMKIVFVFFSVHFSAFVCILSCCHYFWENESF